jgi:hypothetical protein
MFDVTGPFSLSYRRPSITATASSSNEEDRVKCHMELRMGKKAGYGRYIYSNKFTSLPLSRINYHIRSDFDRKSVML